MIRSIFSARYLAARPANLRDLLRRRRPAREERQRGSDLRYDMQIKLEEAAFGVEKEIEIRSSTSATNATAAVPRLAHAASIARRAAAAPGGQLARILPRLANLSTVSRRRSDH